MKKSFVYFLMLSGAYAGSALDIVQEKAYELKEIRKIEQDPQDVGNQKAICDNINRILSGTNSRISEINHAGSDERIKTLGAIFQNIIVSGKKKLRTFKKSEHDYENQHRAALSLMEWGMYSIYKNPMLGADRQNFMDNILSQRQKLEKNPGSEITPYLLKYLNESTLEILFPQGYFHHAATYAYGFKDYKYETNGITHALALEGAPLTRPDFNLPDWADEIIFSPSEFANKILSIKTVTKYEDGFYLNKNYLYVLDQQDKNKVGKVFYEKNAGQYLPIKPLYPEKIIAKLLEIYNLDDVLEFDFKKVDDKIIPVTLKKSAQGKTLRQIFPDLFEIGVDIASLWDCLKKIQLPTKDVNILEEALWLLLSEKKTHNLSFEEATAFFQDPISVMNPLKTSMINGQFDIDIKPEDLDLFEYNEGTGLYTLKPLKAYITFAQTFKKQILKDQIIQDFKGKKTESLTLDTNFKDLLEDYAEILKNPDYRDPNFLKSFCKDFHDLKLLTKELLDLDASYKSNKNRENKTQLKNLEDKLIEFMNKMFKDQKKSGFSKHFFNAYNNKKFDFYNYINHDKLNEYFLTLGLAMKRIPDLLNIPEAWNQEDLESNILTEDELNRDEFKFTPNLDKEENVLDMVALGYNPLTVGLQVYIHKKVFKDAGELIEEDQDIILNSFPLFKEKPYLLNLDESFKYTYFSF